MNFECYGPFALDWYSDVKQWKSEFWKSIESNQELEGLKNAIGCYVFCMKHGDTYTPWYVGKTENKIGFEGEVFTDHKYYIYQKLIEKDKTRHQPCFMFFPLMTYEHWNFSKNRSEGSKHIDWLETTLISMAYSVNRKLKNDKKTSLSLIHISEPTRPY